MQLYSRAISPFSARVRISIAAKGLPVRIIDGPDVASDMFGRLNPMRRVPVLVLDDGTAIPESDAIVEYLEDVFPEQPLRPADPLARAHVRAISRSAELYVFPACVPIFGAPAAQHDGLFAALDHALGQLASLLDPAGWHAWGSQLSTADAALTVFLFYVQVVGGSCARAPLAAHARLQAFWEQAQRHPVLSTAIGEMARAMAERRAQAGG